MKKVLGWLAIGGLVAVVLFEVCVVLIGYIVAIPVWLAAHPDFMNWHGSL